MSGQPKRWKGHAEVVRGKIRGTRPLRSISPKPYRNHAGRHSVGDGAAGRSRDPLFASYSALSARASSAAAEGTPSI